MDDKITIIEGPPPTFDPVNDGWAIGLTEGPFLYDTVVTHLRTFNGNSLVERCHRAWKDHSNIYLHYKDDMGLEEKAPILAARAIETEDGEILVLWIRQKPEETELELDIDIDDDDDEFEL